jgi:hypothetical protein
VRVSPEHAAQQALRRLSQSWQTDHAGPDARVIAFIERTDRR